MLKTYIKQSKPALYLEFFSRIGPVAVLRRIVRKIRYSFIYPFFGKKLFRSPDGIWNYEPHHPLVLKSLNLFYARKRQIILSQADEILKGWFSFLNKKIFLGIPVKWNKIKGSDPLWLYNLHYGEWAKILGDAFLLTGKKDYLRHLILLMENWIDNNQPGSLPAWEPYPISRRISVWSMVAISLKGNSDWDFFCKNKLFPSIWSQCLMLEKNPENDMANNHLIANFKALAWIGLVFPNWNRANIWKNTGLNGLWKEMGRQILPDGVHNERSISYHKIVLLDFLEIKTLCEALGYNYSEKFDKIISKMVCFLTDMEAPDGSFPMFNDSVSGYPENFDSIFMDLKKDYIGKNKKPVSIYSDAGYGILRLNNDFKLWFDFGDMGPYHLPGHGHADALSISLFGAGRWLISDPGVYSYHNKKWRDYFRSTLAHCTACVDGKDQAIFWGPFRAAYPPKARLADWSDSHITGEHYGYCRFNEPVIHRRRVEILSENRLLITDFFNGRGSHEFAFILSFGSNAQTKIKEFLGANIKWNSGVSLLIKPIVYTADARAFIKDGWLSSDWNKKEKTCKYILMWKADVPCKNTILLQIKKSRNSIY